MSRPLAERFAEKTQLDPATGCLVWTGNMGGFEDAYGRIRVDGHLILAHILNFSWKHGRLPEKKLAKMCATPGCVEHWVETGTARVKACRKCGSTDREPPRKGTALGNCRQCHRDAEASRHATPEGQLRARQAHRRRLYGLTPEEQDAMYAAQGGKCACCGDPIDQHDRNTHLDHNHETGEVRGFVCGDDNTAVARVRESSNRADMVAAYLRRYGK